MLKLHEYRDNNNFLRINFVEHSYNRWSLVETKELFSFIDVISY